ncbi:MAG: hypothetical protein IJJ26_05425 [Victivallales bacterium]|nr:hypothetical protein [Victivallales bacterium]
MQRGASASTRYSQTDINDNGPISRGVSIQDVNDIAEREGFTCRVIAEK